VLVVAACHSTAPVIAPPPAPVPVAVTEVADDQPCPALEQIDELENSVAQERALREAAEQEVNRCQEEIAAKTDLVNVLEERLRAVDEELARALEEVFRREATLRYAANRSLAIARVSEVRALIEAPSPGEDEEVEDRRSRAEELLSRADEALAEDNYASAGFFADRAGELLRQAELMSQFRSSVSSHSILPIIPPRRMLVQVASANLRVAPGRDQAIAGSVSRGQEVTAVARTGEWFEIETAGGKRLWIHGTLVSEVPRK
jgi:hypothetical protein